MSVNRACAVTGPGSPGLDPGCVCCWGGGGGGHGPFWGTSKLHKTSKKKRRACACNSGPF